MFFEAVPVKVSQRPGEDMGELPAAVNIAQLHKVATEAQRTEIDRDDLSRGHYVGGARWIMELIPVLKNYNVYLAERKRGLADLRSLTPDSLPALGRTIDAFQQLIEREKKDPESNHYNRDLAEAAARWWRGVFDREMDSGLIRDYHTGFLAWYHGVLRPEHEQLVAKSAPGGRRHHSTGDGGEEPNPTIFLDDFQAVFLSLFVRLSILSETTLALFLYRNRTTNEISVHGIEKNEATGVLELNPRPRRMVPPAWMEPRGFLSVREQDLVSHLTERLPRAGDAGVRALVLEDRDGDNVALTVFGWRDRKADAYARGLLRLERTLSVPRTALLTLESMHDLVAQKLMQTRFFTEMAHNTRDPIVGAMAPMRAIEKGHATDETARELATVAYEQLSGAHSAVMSLLSVRFKGGIVLKPCVFDIKARTEEILRVHHPQCRSDHVQLRLELITDQRADSVPCFSDPDAFETVMNNLLTNARKYSAIVDGKNVTVAIEWTDSVVTVSVNDEGIGIRKDERRDLFQPYYRSDRVRTTVAGTGLGLYISQSYVKALKGNIWLDQRKEGKGATFRFTLQRFLEQDSKGG
jgi:signal transduction histidine kinase